MVGAPTPSLSQSGVLPSVNPLLVPHGRQWKVAQVTAEHDDVSDVRPRIRWHTVFRGSHAEAIASPAQYFKLFFPLHVLPTVLELTNDNIRAQDDSDHTLLRSEEFLKYLGVRLSMALDPIGGYKEYWEDTSEPLTFSIPRRYGQVMKMTRSRFEEIERNLQLCEEVQVSGSAFFWSEVRTFIRVTLGGQCVAF